MSGLTALSLVLSLGFAMMSIGFLLYLLSMGSNVFGLQNSMAPNLVGMYFFVGVACNVASAYIVIRH